MKLYNIERYRNRDSKRELEKVRKRKTDYAGEIE